jgi:hypothetical protein
VKYPTIKSVGLNNFFPKKHSAHPINIKIIEKNILFCAKKSHSADNYKVGHPSFLFNRIFIFYIKYIHTLTL